MAIGLVGRKAGMTRVFTDAGETVPCTVIEVLPNRVTQVKTQEKDGYRAVQVTYGQRRPQLYSKAVAGHYAKANVAPGKALVEFRLEPADKAELKKGDKLLKVAGQKVTAQEQVRQALAKRKPGDKIDVEVERGGKVLALSVEIGAPPADE